MAVEHRHISSSIAFALIVICLGCQTANQETRSWRAIDHDRAEGQEVVGPPSTPLVRANESQPGQAPTQSPHAADTSGVAQTLQVWMGKCMRCHGQIGAGDGPDGAASGARNLTDPNWQSAVSDERIRSSILMGRGRMPSFALDSEMTSSLVRLVRQMGHRGDVPSAASSAAEPTVTEP